MAVLLKFGQELVIIDVPSFPAAQSSQSCVYGKPVQPGGKPRRPAECFGFAVNGPKDILDDFFSVGDLAENAPRDVIEFRRVKIENCFERFLVAGLEALDQRCLMCGR